MLTWIYGYTDLQKISQKKEQLLAAKHYTTLSENIEKKESLLTYQDKKGTEDNWRDESTD